MTSETKHDLICNGELEIIKITPNIHDEVVEFLKANFMKNENLCIACEMSSSVTSVREMEMVVRIFLQEGFGFVVRHCVSKELVALCVNTIITPETDKALDLDFQSPSTICGAEFVTRIKSSFDIFKEWKIDCVVEIEFLSTRNDFGGRGLALILTERSIEFARRMLKGTLEQTAHEALPAQIKGLKPQAVCSIFTSLFTQKVGEKLSMETLVKIPFTEFFYEGKSFAEKIDPIHKHVTYDALRLE